MPAFNVVPGIEAEYSGTYQYWFARGLVLEQMQAAGMPAEAHKILVDTGDKLLWLMTLPEQWTPTFPKNFVLPPDKNPAQNQRGGRRSFNIRFKGIPTERTQRKGGKGTYWGRDVQVTGVLELTES